MITQRCANCGKIRQFGDEALGKKYRCQQCENVSVIDGNILSPDKGSEWLEYGMNRFTRGLTVVWRIAVLVLLFWIALTISCIGVKISSNDLH